jgi:DNA-binding MarR family transcriptional regulator
MADYLGSLLFKEKQARIFIALAKEGKEWHISDLAKATDVTYVHTSKFISRCEKLGLVATERHGRTKRLYLTESGADVAGKILEIMGKIGQAKENAEPSQPPGAKGS